MNTNFFRSTIFLFSLIFILGIFLRLVNVSPFKFYPDSYQSLVVSENINDYRNVLGFFGKDGMLYPDFFMWTRPVYPMVINIIDIFINNKIFSAHLVSLVLGISAIPITYFLLLKIFNSKAIGIFGSLILTLSFNHTVWSGFIMTETTGVFILLLFLYFLFSNLKSASKFGNVEDLFTGALFSFAVFTRYEYIALLLPVTLLVLKLNPNPKIFLVNLYSSFLITLILFLGSFYTLPDTLYIFFEQTQTLIKYGVIFLLVALIGIFYYFKNLRQKDQLWNNATKIFLFSFLIFTFYSLAQSILLSWGITTPILLSGLKDALYNDFILFLTFFVGCFGMLKNKKYSPFLLPLLISIFILSVVYYRVNPDMLRYYTHVIPFMIIPSAFGLNYVFNYLKKIKSDKRLIYGSAVLLLFFIQFVISANGLKSWRNGDFFKLNYEEASSRKLKLLLEKDDILLVSAPEPYYLFTGNSTHSISDIIPYIYIDDKFNDRTAIVVEDLGMEKYFPNFSKIVDDTLQEYKIAEFQVEENFLFGNEIIMERKPIRVYKIKLQDLKYIIKFYSLSVNIK